MDKFGSFMLGMLFGAAIAAGVTLLYAPQTGEETRRILSEKSQEAKEQAKQIATRAQEASHRVSEKGQEYMA